MSYAVDWEEFKKEFIHQHVPADAIATLQKWFEELAVTGSIREFNEKFRLLRMRLRVATNEPAMEMGDSPEVNRTQRAKAEAPLVTSYELNLPKAGEVEFKRGDSSGPMSKVYPEYTKMRIENSQKSPPYEHTIEDVMVYMETMDNVINHRNTLETMPVNSTSLFTPGVKPTTTTANTPAPPVDMMDLEASRMEGTAQLFAMFEKVLSGTVDNCPKCSHCKKAGHVQMDCWKLNGLPDWIKEKSKKKNGGGGKKNTLLKTTEMVVAEDSKN